MWNTDHVPSFSSCKVVTIGQDGLKYCQMPKGSRDANRTTCLPSLSAAAAMTRMTMGWQGTWHETTKASVSHHCPPLVQSISNKKKQHCCATIAHDKPGCFWFSHGSCLQEWCSCSERWRPVRKQLLPARHDPLRWWNDQGRSGHLGQNMREKTGPSNGLKDAVSPNYSKWCCSSTHRIHDCYIW